MSIIATGAKAPRTPKTVATVAAPKTVATVTAVTTPASQEMTLEQLKAELAAARAENAKLKGQKSKAGISFRVSSKGAVSVYGLGRFPVTLYKEQFERLIDAVPELQAFMKDNSDVLSVKGDKE